VQYVTSTLYVHIHTDKHWLGLQIAIVMPPKSTVIIMDSGNITGFAQQQCI